MADGKKAETANLVDYRCCGCNKIAGRIKEGSKLAKGTMLICETCRGKMMLYKKCAEMFRKEAEKKQNPFGKIFEDLFNSQKK